MAIVRVQNQDGTISQVDDSTLSKPMPQKPGAIRALGDTLLKFGSYGLGATKAAVDAAGPNVVSTALGKGAQALEGAQSDYNIALDQIAAQRSQNASGKGAMAEIGATLKNFADRPVATIAGGVGSIVPTAAAMIASRGKINPAVSGIGLGAVQGAGAVKGSIYDAVKQDAVAKGIPEQEANKLATDAQAYSGQNRDQIALGAGLGAVAGATGAEATSLLTGSARETAKSRLRETLKGFATEGGTEAAQGGQEQYAANVAMNRLGAGIDPMRGVAGQATAEGIAGGVVGAGFSLADTFQAKEQLKSTIMQQGNGGVISQAAATAVDTGAAQPALGLPNYVGEPLVTFPDGTTMTRAEANAKYTADELAQFEQRVGMNQKPAVAGLLQTREENPLIVFADGSTGTKQQFDDYLAGLPDEAERMKARARFLGYAPQQAETTQTQTTPVSGLLQARDQDPMIVYPDGSTGKRSEFDGYINSLPEQQRVTEMARLLGYGPQQGGENVGNTTANQAPQVATGAIPNAVDNPQGSAGTQLSDTGARGMDDTAATLGASGAGDIQSGADANGRAAPVETYVIRDKQTGDVIRATENPNEQVSATYELVPAKQHKQDVKAGKFKTVDLNSAKTGDVINLNGVQWRKLDNGGFEQVMTADLQETKSSGNELMDAFLNTLNAPNIKSDSIAKLDRGIKKLQSFIDEKKSKVYKENNTKIKLGDASVDRDEGMPFSSTRTIGDINEAKRDRDIRAWNEEIKSLEALKKAINDNKITLDDYLSGKPQSVRQFYEQIFSDGAATSTSNPTSMAPSNDITANDAATSVFNELPEPTEAQKQAGNYKVGRMKVGGLDVSVENPDQSMRTGKDPDGTPWETVTNGHYGYIKGVKARSPDKEHVDVNVKPGTAQDFAGDVFIVNQNDPRSGKFDEPKVYMGYTDEAEAEAAYRSNYAPDWQGFGNIARVPMDKFKAMLADSTAFMKPVVAEKPGKNKRPQPGQAGYTLDMAKEDLSNLIDQQRKNGMFADARLDDRIKNMQKVVDDMAAEQGGSTTEAGNTTQNDEAAEVALKSAQIRRRELPEYTDPKIDTVLAQENYLKSIAQDDKEKAQSIVDAFRSKPSDYAKAANVSEDLIGRYASIIERQLNVENEKATNKARIEQARVEKDKVNGHVRDFERTLFNAASSLSVNDIDTFLKFASVNKQAMIDALNEIKKDADPLQLKAIEKMLDGGQLKLSADFWKNAFREARKNAGIDVSRKKKLENTGITLRRYWQLNKQNVDKASDWKAIEKSTSRATAFNPEIAEDADPKLASYIEVFRTAGLKTFGEWMDSERFGSRLRGRVKKGIIQNIQEYLNGDVYLSGSLGDTAEQRLQFIKDKANEYLNLVNRFNEALSGAKTIDEFAEKYESFAKSSNVTQFPDYVEFSTRDSNGVKRITANANRDVSQFYFYEYSYSDETEAEFKERALAKLNETLSEQDIGSIISKRFYVRSWYKNAHGYNYALTQASKEGRSRKESLIRPRLDTISRTGRKDYRNGKDVTPQELKDTFGLADVGFGEYVNAVQDQKHLNHAFDAFKDLATILGLPDKAIGLGGKLHFTIGALGHGKAAATYIDNQPTSDGKGTVHVINLTNTRGDGTLAHEWMHALDFHIMHYDPEGYERLNTVRSTLTDKYNFDNVIRQVKSFLRGTVYYSNKNITGRTKQEQALYYLRKGGAVKPGVTVYKSNADALGEDYWGNTREIWARAGEAYVFDQFNDTSSDYLVTDWVADGKVTDEKFRGTPYPRDDERKLFNQAFKAFFDALEVTDTGIKVSADKFKLKDPRSEHLQKVEELAENLPGYIKQWEIDDENERRTRENARDQDSNKLIAEQKRIEEARIQAELEAAAKASNKTDSLSDSDLEAIFDEAASELREQATEQPDTVIGEPRASDTVYKDKEVVAKPRDPEIAKPKSADEKAAAKLVAEAAKLGVKGIDEALTGLTKLFGGSPGRLNSFPSGFDEDSYNQAKPHFEAALAAFIDAGKTLKDLFKFLIQNLGEGVKPYAIQFAKEKGLGAQLGNKGGQESADDIKQSEAGDTGRDEIPGALDGEGTQPGRNDGSDANADGRSDAGRNRDSGTSVSAGESQRVGSGAELAAQDDTGSGDSEQYGVPGTGSTRRLSKNFVIPSGGLTRIGSWRDSAILNLDIIELVKQLERDNQQATPEQQQKLAKYVGFGASNIRNNLFPSDAFRGGEYRPGWVPVSWRDLAERANNLLNKDELETMLRSTQYAHYTSEGITRGIWSMLERFGFSGGKVIEPGMGSGNFVGTMPMNIAANSTYSGIEMDKLTASIAKQLYPDSNIIEGDYTQVKMPDGYFDVAIGNPPFSDVVIKQDAKYKKYGFALHDYFFAKTIDKVRDGGLLVFVTSKGTMDKKNSRARKYLADRADLVGAIRFPQTAFKENAGTEVVTDVIILRKRAAGQEPSGISWMNMKEVQTDTGTTLVNEYFADHPEMVLGKHAIAGGMYRASGYTVIPNENSDIEADFNKAIQRLPANIYSDTRATPATKKTNAIERDMNPKSKKEGGMYVDDKGNLMVVESGVGVSVQEAFGIKRASEIDFLKDYVELRDALKQARYDQWNGEGWEASLKNLNAVYNKFVKKNGNIKAFTVSEETEENADGEQVTIERKRYKNWRLIKRDVEGTIVWALEDVKEDGSIVKAAALNGRVVNKPTKPVIETAQDALAVVLDEMGLLDIDKVAEYAGLTKEQVIKELDDLIFELPSGQWQMRDEYLSGYVIDKLEEAEQAAKMDSRFEKNVKALLLVQPKPLIASDITVALGANWVPAEIIEEFASDVMDVPMSITYNDALSKWMIDGSRSRYNRNRTTDWGTSDKSAQELLEAVLNSKTIDIVRKTDEGSFKDQKATAAVNELMKKMAEQFKSWVWTDAVRAERLMAIYNRKFNNIAPRQFDGKHLTLPGISSRFKLHPHQKRAIWRVIQSGNTYLAHAVGAGKTYEMIASGMEQRRLGMIRRPMYVVPNHMLEQFASEFIDLYPTANVMVADKDNFGKQERQRFTAQAAINDPDAIVITHSAFKLLSMKPENYDNIINEQLDDLRIKLESLEGDDRISRRQIENQIEKLESRIKGKTNQEAKDANVTFEDLGVDFLFVDEAHEFRKLDFATNRTKVKGISPGGSERAIDLYTKVRYLETLSPGRSHVFASGTPVTNTMGELYTVMKFFAEQEMKDDGLIDFDSWATMFGEVVGDWEANSSGKYEFVERFAKFQNVPELMKRVRKFMDVLTSSSLGTLVKRPDIVGGQRKIVVTPQPQNLKDYMRTVLEPRIQASKEWKPSQSEPNNPDPIIAIIGDARLANIDMRFINPQAPNDPDSKLNKMIDGIIEVYKRTKGKKFFDESGKEEAILGATQIVFANVGFGDGVAKRRGFSARDWVNQRLKEAGIPTSEVAWMSDYDTSSKKQAMFREMKTGAKKILFGSPKNMGTGTNVQKRLIALQYLDPPWYPSDLEQPEGRILRQGNLNEEIELYAYATKGSYDSTMWQMVARKGLFIEQAFTGDDSVRTLEDISEASSYQMAAALASGDNRVIELANLEAKVVKFSRLRDAHATQQRELRTKKVVVEASMRSANERKEKIKEAIKKVGDGLYSEVSFVVGKNTYKDRAEFGQALIQAYGNADDAITNIGDRVDIAKLNDKFTVSAVIGTVGGNIEKRLVVGITDALEFTVDSGSIADKDAFGLASRIVNQVNRVKSMLSDVDYEIEQIERELNAVSKKIGAPFEYEQELMEAISDAASLKQELAQTGDADQVADDDQDGSASFSRSQRRELVEKSEVDALGKLFDELQTDKPLRKKIAMSKVEKHPLSADILRVERDFYDIIGQLEDEGRLKINCKD